MLDTVAARAWTMLSGQTGLCEATDIFCVEKGSKITAFSNFRRRVSNYSNTADSRLSIRCRSNNPQVPSYHRFEYTNGILLWCYVKLHTLQLWFWKVESTFSFASKIAWRTALKNLYHGGRIYFRRFVLFLVSLGIGRVDTSSSFGHLL